MSAFAAGWVPGSNPAAGVPFYDIAAIQVTEPIEGAKFAALAGPEADLGETGLNLQVTGYGETEFAFSPRWAAALISL